MSITPNGSLIPVAKSHILTPGSLAEAALEGVLAWLEHR